MPKWVAVHGGGDVVLPRLGGAELYREVMKDVDRHARLPPRREIVGGGGGGVGLAEAAVANACLRDLIAAPLIDEEISNKSERSSRQCLCASLRLRELIICSSHNTSSVHWYHITTVTVIKLIISMYRKSRGIAPG